MGNRATLSDVLLYEAGVADGAAKEQARIVALLDARKLEISGAILADYPAHTDDQKAVQRERLRQDKLLVSLRRAITGEEEPRDG
jgi:hypothetical protein